MSNDAVAHSFNTLGIVGTGAMGRGIAQLAAQAGLNVMLFDVKEGAVAEATAFIHELWQRSADKQRITQAQAEQYGERALSRVENEHQSSVTPSHVPIDVQRPHVAAPEFADVYASSKAGDEVGRRESAKEGGNGHAKNKQGYI